MARPFAEVLSSKPSFSSACRISLPMFLTHRLRQVGAHRCQALWGGEKLRRDDTERESERETIQASPPLSLGGARRKNENEHRGIFFSLRPPPLLPQKRASSGNSGLTDTLAFPRLAIKDARNKERERHNVLKEKKGRGKKRRKTMKSITAPAAPSATCRCARASRR